MSCDMIYEWMQRDLDDDLSHVEKQRLLAHVSSCQSCSELYERLHSLSAHLAKLPAVTPPVSIVQSIMPRLDEIDRMKAGRSEQAAAFETGVEKTGLRSERKIFWFRSLAGAAAAAAVLTITIWNMEDSPLQHTAFSPTPPQVEGRVAMQGADKPSSAKPSAANAAAAGEKSVTPSQGQQTAVPSEKPPAATQLVNKAKTNGVLEGKKNEAPDKVPPSSVAGTAPKVSNQVPDNQMASKQEKAAVAEKTEAPAANSQADNVPDQKQEKTASEPAAVSSPEQVAGKRGMMLGFVAPDDAKDKAENNARAAESEKVAVSRALTEEFFVSKNGNRLLVRDGNGQIKFATHDWGDMYGVSYRWIDSHRISYTLDYQGTSAEIGPRPQTQEWLIDLHKNIERPLFK
ncbi:zf-HC2 domain-containing protein [Aneurinibacillus uraniidurans]|uniref:zf-HC2 domain-containing protein n=1 Tax=Aneurinibacillus uraniidurans TaxID=2966586 RepID=UPI00234A40C5|nr:zf-HC2 domain-containing protein [Aneurinibacillus sp. B1]WCN38716.1 zf-HC2 domain-containing protein [Aneurinibacillus sp. B1]